MKERKESLEVFSAKLWGQFNSEVGCCSCSSERYKHWLIKKLYNNIVILEDNK